MQEGFVTRGDMTKRPNPLYAFCMEKRKLGTHYIRQWRDKRGLSLEQLADRMEKEPGVRLLTPMSISRIERGQQPFTEATLYAFASALDCSPSDLIEVNPLVEGDVIDLLRAMSDEERRKAIQVLRAMTGTG